MGSKVGIDLLVLDDELRLVLGAVLELSLAVLQLETETLGQLLASVSVVAEDDARKHRLVSHLVDQRHDVLFRRHDLKDLELVASDLVEGLRPVLELLLHLGSAESAEHGLQLVRIALQPLQEALLQVSFQTTQLRTRQPHHHLHP